MGTPHSRILTTDNRNVHQAYSAKEQTSAVQAFEMPSICGRTCANSASIISTFGIHARDAGRNAVFFAGAGARRTRARLTGPLEFTGFGENLHLARRTATCERRSRVREKT